MLGIPRAIFINVSSPTHKTTRVHGLVCLDNWLWHNFNFGTKFDVYLTKRTNYVNSGLINARQRLEVNWFVNIGKVVQYNCCGCVQIKTYFDSIDAYLVADLIANVGSDVKVSVLVKLVPKA
ncbi:hypothetical protein BpHYR1_023202 [Brachionus plicatilis]|uniref:Uncharacterized protein n=1 Tax=Brachionus plicatilis TaxID=10195 RepID=A0A3M7PUA2_BRAPC|nr:hypothetical protein BpHYR1_023202 [Brachionus plicatilis]